MWVLLIWFCSALSCIVHRLWTRGYDVYTPNKIAVAHDYYDKLLPAGQAPLITVSSRPRVLLYRLRALVGVL
jgi:hypothetical protein